MKSYSKIVALTALGLQFSLGAMSAASAQEQAPNEVRMLNKDSHGVAKAFEPALLPIEPGGTVDFVAWDFGHDLVSVKGLHPEGAEEFSGYKNADTSVSFDKEGVYVYECAAHRAAGMVGVVVVGDASANLDDILASYQDNPDLSPAGKERLGPILASLKSK